MTLEEGFVWAMKTNLDVIVGFHNEIHRLLRNEIVHVNKKAEACDNESSKRDILHRKDIYLTTYEKMLRANTFLMIYSHLEEFLYHAPQTVDKDAPIENRGSIKRFKQVFKEVLRVDLEKDPDWQFICNCEKIRDCILHANGRIDLLRNPGELETIIAQSNGLLKTHVKKVEITGGFLKKLSEVCQSFIARVKTATEP